MKNIILIGMPSSGKSTVGMALAQVMGMEFVDTDSLIRERAGKPLKDIVNEDGLKRFLELQEDVLLNLNADSHIIATGGSVVYGEASINHLKSNGIVIFLKVDYNEIEQRVTSDRRFARNDGQNLSDLYNERMPLYEKYADIAINCTGKKVEEIVEKIMKSIAAEESVTGCSG